MDFTKFISLLETRQLYFSRSDLLGDPFEGSVPEIYRERHQHAIRRIFGNISDEGIAALEADRLRHSTRTRRSTYVSCWHLNNGESAAMWNLYAKTNEAVAIQSTCAKLQDAFDSFVLLGKVEYIDYSRDALVADSLISPYFYKRTSFEHEKEIRAVLSSSPELTDGVDFEAQSSETGIGVDIDISNFVDRIYVAPTSPQWFASLIRSVCKRYKLRSPITQSSLDSKPFY